MTPCRLLICSGGIGAVLTCAMLGTVASGIAQKDTAKTEVERCAAYSGLPTEQGETAAMALPALLIYNLLVTLYLSYPGDRR
jgi:hypothetical protein